MKIPPVANGNGKNVGRGLTRDLSLLLFVAAASGAAGLFSVLREPQGWILVPRAWMGTLSVQRLLHVILGMGLPVWAAIWAVIGLELDGLILFVAKKRSLRLHRVSFVALWLLAYFGGSATLLAFAPESWAAALLKRFPYSVAPVAAALALPTHVLSVALFDNQRVPRIRSFAVVMGGAAACLAAIFANIYWLPDLLSVSSLVWTVAIFLSGLVLASVLWVIDLQTLERVLQRLSNACLLRPVLPTFLLASVLVVAILSGIERPRAAAEKRPTRPNIILVTVDTLRADHLSSYGYHLVTSPNLDHFAEEATRFTHCISCAPITNPSVASIMTSQYPSFHSLGAAGGNRQPMLLSEVTLAKVLSKNGYRTAAFVSNFVLRRKMRFYVGFDLYDDTFTSYEPTRGLLERTADKTTEYALNWLKNGAKESFFLWVHYQDPHGPYTPPERYLEHFPERTYSSGPKTLPVTDNTGKGGIPEYQYFSGQTSPAYYRSRYDGEIAYADECIGRLFAGIKTLGLWERSIVVFTADHGESMGEHGYYFCHQQDVTDELLHVPLIIRIPGAEQARKVDELVSTIDIGPTLLESAGVVEKLGTSGLSLMPLIRGRTQSLGREHVVSEDTHGRICFHSRETKYISGPDGERLYDLTRDPLESKNVLKEKPDLALTWHPVRDSYLSEAKPRSGTVQPPDRRDVETLKSLGYIN